MILRMFFEEKKQGLWHIVLSIGWGPRNSTFLAAKTVKAESESDVCRRQILTSEVDPHPVTVNIFLMVVDPSHRYSNESESVH